MKKEFVEPIIDVIVFDNELKTDQVMTTSNEVGWWSPSKFDEWRNQEDE